MQVNYATVAQDLAHVYWIGGSPCSGKSSIADALVETYSFELYRCDEAYFEHAKIVTPERQPTFHRLIHLSSEDLWMRPVAQQIIEEVALYREEFPLIVKDLLSRPRTRPILAEGAALLPECVQPLLLHPQQAIWIIPTREFQMHHYIRREWAKDVVKKCTNPEQAFLNWMQRDIGFAQKVRDEAARRALQVLIVDGQHSLLENRKLVEHQFGIPH
jgi:hypothetical protein